MQKVNYFLVLCCLAIVFSSCKDDDDPEVSCSLPESRSSLKITFVPTWSGEVVQAASEYEDQFGNRLLQFNFKTFISNIRISSDGEDLELSEVELLSFDEGAVSLSYSIPDNNSYDQLKFATGVPSEYNVDYDPSTWPNDHPLSVQGAQGMHWSWNTGYIFTKFDGKADTTDVIEPVYLYPFAFHTGADEFYFEHEFDIDIATQVQTDTEIQVTIQMEKFFDGQTQIDIRDDGETHTGGDFGLAEEFINNFNQSFTVE